jgi:hypothetical protein
VAGHAAGAAQAACMSSIAVATNVVIEQMETVLRIVMRRASATCWPSRSRRSAPPPAWCRSHRVRLIVRINGRFDIMSVYQPFPTPPTSPWKSQTGRVYGADKPPVKCSATSGLGAEWRGPGAGGSCSKGERRSCRA